MKNDDGKVTMVSFRMASGDWYTKRIRQDWGDGAFDSAIELAECVEGITADTIRDVLIGKQKIVIKKDGKDCEILPDDSNPSEDFHFYINPVVSGFKIDVRKSINSFIAEFMKDRSFSSDNGEAEEFLHWLESGAMRRIKLSPLHSFIREKNAFEEQQRRMDQEYALTGKNKVEPIGMVDDWIPSKDIELPNDPLGLKASLLQNAIANGVDPSVLNSINLTHDYMMGIKHIDPDQPKEHSLNGIIDLKGVYHICEYFGHIDMAHEKFDCDYDDLVKKNWVEVKQGKFFCKKPPNAKQKAKIFDICQHHKFDYEERIAPCL